MIAKVESAYLKGELKAIPSKSYAHRIAICNYLANGTLSGGCDGFASNDITATLNCLENIKKGCGVLDVGESGSTLRFMLPLCASLGGQYAFIGHGKLLERPNDELFSVMREHGVSVEQSDKIYIDGFLTPGKFCLRGDISSQYISGLLMALPILDGDSEIVLTTPLCSAPYVEITLEVLKSFGIKIDREENRFKILGGQTYLGGTTAEGDWSNLAFFLVGGAVNGDIRITGLNPDSVQGDMFILDILRLAGVEILIENGCVSVKKSKIKAFEFSAKDCPDLVPIASVLGAYSDGKCVIKDVERLRIKESDRILSTITMLKAFNIRAESDGKNLVVYGGKPVGGEIDSFNDHRLTMASAILALGAEGKAILTRAEAINKSYPTFFEDYIKLGGVVQYV